MPIIDCAEIIACAEIGLSRIRAGCGVVFREQFLDGGRQCIFRLTLALGALPVDSVLDFVPDVVPGAHEAPQLPDFQSPAG